MKKKPKKSAKKSMKSVAARKARGPHCVYTPSKKLFNCFAEKTSAANVVKGMNKGYKKTCSKKKITPGEGWTLQSSGR